MFQTPFGSAPRPAAPVLCRFCRRPLSDDAEEVCDRPTCRTRQKVESSATLARKKLQQDADWLELSLRRTRPVIKQAAQDLGISHLGGVAHGLAPYIDMPSVPLPKERRAAFIAYLTDIVEESFATVDGGDLPPQPPEDDPDYARRRTDEQPEPFVLNAACIACQGDCCTMGGRRMAFLETKTIDYLRWRHPDWSRQTIVDTYLSHLPETSTTGSCVYHGPQGCTLDRTLRADICNSFQCRFRKLLAQACKKKPGTGAVVAGLSRNHTEDLSAGAPYLRVVSVSPENEVRVHGHLTLPAVRKGLPDR